jgi:thymidylate kinase
VSSRVSRPARGRWVVIAGPDGAGKSALTDALAATCDPTPLRAHHRIGVLPRRAASLVPVTEPHAAKPYAAWLSYLKVAMLAFDGVAGYLAHTRPALESGRWVLLERGWWDLGVDPRRYRLRVRPGLVLNLARLQPRPDLLVVLDAPVETVLQRKAELDAAEIERQTAMWRSIASSTRSVVLDSRRSVTELVAETRRTVDELDVASPRRPDRVPPRPRYIGLPPGSRPRFLLPTGSRRLAVTGLQVFHPVTRLGRVAWRLARVAGAVGALRLLPARPLPADVEALERVHPGMAWAFQSSPRRTRRTGLAIDASGSIASIVKIALVPSVAARLEVEAQAIVELGPLLGPPVVASRVRGIQPGLLCLEAADWMPRSPAWLLPPDVAGSLGTLYRAGGGDACRGPAQGDFAPWNLMKLRAGGWLLIDWEDATRDGRPFQDPFHWLVQSHILLGRPRVDEIRDGLSGSGWVGLALRRYAEAAGLDDADIRSAFLAHLGWIIATLRASADALPSEVAARERLLAALWTRYGRQDRQVR